MKCFSDILLANLDTFSNRTNVDLRQRVSYVSSPALQTCLSLAAMPYGKPVRNATRVSYTCACACVQLRQLYLFWIAGCLPRHLSTAMAAYVIAAVAQSVHMNFDKKAIEQAAASGYDEGVPAPPPCPFDAPPTLASRRIEMDAIKREQEAGVSAGRSMRQYARSASSPLSHTHSRNASTRTNASRFHAAAEHTGSWGGDGSVPFKSLRDYQAETMGGLVAGAGGRARSGISLHGGAASETGMRAASVHSGTAHAPLYDRRVRGILQQLATSSSSHGTQVRHAT